MATDVLPSRLALHMVPGQKFSDGAWWPQSRLLSDELGQLFALWPSAVGRIVRVLYSPPDWDDRPRSVSLPGGRVKTGCFPRDDTRVLVLTMLDGRHLTIDVIPSDTPADLAAELLGDLGDRMPEETPAGTPSSLVQERDDDHPVWDDEGGHP